MRKAATFFRASGALLLRLYFVCWLLMSLGVAATIVGISLRALDPFFVPLLFGWFLFVAAAMLHSIFLLSQFTRHAVHWLLITPKNLLQIVSHSCGINWGEPPRICSDTWIDLSTKRIPGTAIKFMIIMSLAVMPALNSWLTVPHSVAITLSYVFWAIFFFAILGTSAAFIQITNEAEDCKDAVMRMGSALLPEDQRGPYKDGLTNHIDPEADSVAGNLRYYWYAIFTLVALYWFWLIEPVRESIASVRKEFRNIAKKFNDQNQP